jgi:hypothetical protein
MRKLVKVRLFGEKRGQLWAEGEGVKGFAHAFIPDGMPLPKGCYRWSGLEDALKFICQDDGDFQRGTVAILDIWGEAVYSEGRGTFTLPMEISTATLKRYGFWRDYTD